MLKHTLLGLMLFLLCSPALADSQAAHRHVTDLPATAQLFLKKHFSTLGVRQVTVQPNFIGQTYNVSLAGGGQIGFDDRGNWTCINCQRNAIPESAIPTKILQYIKRHYPDHFTSSIAKAEGGYAAHIHDLALEHDIELNFNSRYQFIVPE